MARNKFKKSPLEERLKDVSILKVYTAGFSDYDDSTREKIELFFPRNNLIYFDRGGALDVEWYARELRLENYFGRIGIPKNVTLEMHSGEFDICGTLSAPAYIRTVTGDVNLFIPTESLLRVHAATRGNLTVNDVSIDPNFEFDTEKSWKYYGQNFKKVRKEFSKNQKATGNQQFLGRHSKAFYSVNILDDLGPLEFCTVYGMILIRSERGNINIKQEYLKQPKKQLFDNILAQIQSRIFPDDILQLKKQLWAAEQEEDYLRAKAIMQDLFDAGYSPDKNYLLGKNSKKPENFKQNK